MSDNDIQTVRELYCEILDCNIAGLTNYDLKDFEKILAPDSLFERFAARKAAGVS